VVVYGLEGTGCSRDVGDGGFHLCPPCVLSLSHGQINLSPIERLHLNRAYHQASCESRRYHIFDVGRKVSFYGFTELMALVHFKAIFGV